MIDYENDDIFFSFYFPEKKGQEVIGELFIFKNAKKRDIITKVEKHKIILRLE